jgi:hypothetical protein
MMRKHASRKPATHRKGVRGRTKSRVRRAVPQGSSIELGYYDPNRGEATS